MLNAQIEAYTDTLVEEQVFLILSEDIVLCTLTCICTKGWCNFTKLRTISEAQYNKIQNRESQSMHSCFLLLHLNFYLILFSHLAKNWV